MKLTFVTTGDIQNIATSKRALGLANPMQQLGYDVSIVMEDTPNNRERVATEAPSAELAWFPRSNQFLELAAKRALLKKLDPDFVYTCTYGLRSLVAPFRPTKKAKMLIEHSELLSAIQRRSLPRRIFDGFIERLGRVSFDGHICASRYLEKLVAEKLGPKGTKPILYSPYAYNNETFHSDPEFIAELHRRYAGRSVLVYMGTVSRNYGILDIIRALSVVRTERPDALLVVLGHGRDAQEARDLVAAERLNDLVEFRGFVPEAEVPAFLERADLFLSPLYPTIQDIARCPSKLFMYMPIGKPIVTCPIGEAKELFGETYPFYFEPENVASLAATIQKALRERDGWRPSWDANEHTWSARAKGFDAWLKKL